MFQALEYLKKIEDGIIDQQEGSVMMGKLLHKVFVNSAIKKSENIDLNSDFNTITNSNLNNLNLKTEVSKIKNFSFNEIIN